MKRILALSLFAVLAAGCATTSSVKEEIAPCLLYTSPSPRDS